MFESPIDIISKNVQRTFVFSEKLLIPIFTTSKSAFIKTFVINGVEFYEIEWDKQFEGRLVIFRLLKSDEEVDTKQVNMLFNADEDTLDVIIEYVPGGVVINSKLFLNHKHWNCLIYIDGNTIKCVMCGVIIFVTKTKQHIESVIHKTNLVTYQPLSSYGLTITRRIRDRFHCGVCNVYLNLTKEGDHYATDQHRTYQLLAFKKICNYYESEFDLEPSDVGRNSSSVGSQSRNANNNVILNDRSSSINHAASVPIGNELASYRNLSNSITTHRVSFHTPPITLQPQSSWSTITDSVPSSVSRLQFMQTMPPGFTDNSIPYGPLSMQKIADYFTSMVPKTPYLQLVGPLCFPTAAPGVVHLTTTNNTVGSSFPPVGVLTPDDDKENVVNKQEQNFDEFFRIANDNDFKLTEEEKEGLEFKEVKDNIFVTNVTVSREREVPEGIVSENDAKALRELFEESEKTFYKQIRKKNKRAKAKKNAANKKTQTFSEPTSSNESKQDPTQVPETPIEEIVMKPKKDNFKDHIIKLNYIALTKLLGMDLKLFNQCYKIDLIQLTELSVDENAKFNEIFDEEDHVFIKLKECYFRLTNTAYNCIVQYGRSSKYCVVCSEQIEIRNLKKHEYSRQHKLKLSEYHFMEDYSEHLLREVKTIVHCTVCNLIIWNYEINDHIRWAPHLLVLKLTKQSDKKIRKYETKSNIKVLTLSTKEEQNVVTEPVILKPIDPHTLIDFKTVRIEDHYFKLNYENWNGIIKSKKGFKCQLCSVNFDNLTGHLSNENHLANTENSFMIRYAPLLIRQIDSNQVHCVTCNTEIQNREKMIVQHKSGKKHIRLYEAVRINTVKKEVPREYFHIM